MKFGEAKVVYLPLASVVFLLYQKPPHLTLWRKLE